MNGFVHLHTHSHYSLLSALPKIPELVKAAVEQRMEALALTDNGNLYGAVEFYKECKKQNIKPIIGVDFYLALRSRRDKEAGIDHRRHRLVLLAKDHTGYQNLVRLVTRSHLEGFYYKPRIDHELLEEYHEGLICIIPSFSGETSALLRGGDPAGAAAIVTDHKKHFGNENVFLEVTHHPEVDGHETLMERIATLGTETATPLVAAHDVYYLNPDDRVARDTMVSIQTGGMRDRTRGFDDSEADFSFISSDTAERFFAHVPEALENTARIAERCTVALELGGWVFPRFEIPEGTTYNDELRRLAYEGFERRKLAQTPPVEERLEYELGIIAKKGYGPYFLVVSDLISAARERNILTNTRGSAAGSLVSYLTGITNVDPIEYQLPFERFLNPERPSPPDIDMDFADNRRDEMIDYVKQKYGADKVAQIGTFGTMMARGGVRDTARALGYDYATGDRIAKLIPLGRQGFPMTIDQALELEPDLKKIYEDEEDAQHIIDMARKIEGCARHISVHAAGVVVSPTPLSDSVPLQYDPKGEEKVITQYDMYAIEDIGLLKFDFLGLKNLAILADAVKRVRQYVGVDIDIERIPLDDKKTYTMLGHGETMGLFQLGGSGMTRYLKDLKPTEIHDINAMVALYRPGPLESIPSYIARKHDPKLVTYLDPRMEEILERSYGVITYQDDVLLIAIHLAGYSWLEADKLRKAMGKKIPAEMAAQKEKFISGCIDHRLSPEKAMQLWQLIEPFAAYGFNKAHAASYGRLAYQTAYMKANYPALYMAAVLTADAGNIEEVAEIVGECKRMNIEVLPPDINESFGDFTVVTGADGRDLPAPRRENHYYVYAILCDDESIYIGQTEDLEKRWQEHCSNAGADHTRQHKPLSIIHYEEFLNREEAVKREHDLKTGFGRKRLKRELQAGRLKSYTAARQTGRIRFGLHSIKNFGQGIADTIIAERDARGAYHSLADFLMRIRDRNLNKKSLESLIQCGALDSLGERGSMFENIDTLLAFNRAAEAESSAQHDSLFGDAGTQEVTVRLRDAPAASMEQRLQWEKELLGLYVSGHPFDAHKEKIGNGGMTVARIKADGHDGIVISLTGLVEECKEVMTKNGERMGFLKIDDTSGIIETVVFPRLYKTTHELLEQKGVVRIIGKISHRNGAVSIVAEKIQSIA